MYLPSKVTRMDPPGNSRSSRGKPEETLVGLSPGTTQSSRPVMGVVVVAVVVEAVVVEVVKEVVAPLPRPTS